MNTVHSYNSGGTKKAGPVNHWLPVSNTACGCMLLAAYLSILMVCGCALDALGPAGTFQNKIFKSDDYLVYQIKGGETSVTLAAQFLGDASKAWVIEDANENMPLKTNHYVVIPLKPRNKGGITDNGFQQVPILCYHRFGNHCASPLCVPTQIFDSQMRYLHDNGYRVISPLELLAYLEYRQPLPKRAVMITIDDGYRSAYTVAYPILKKYGFTATLFVYTNFVGVSSQAITWAQLRELKSNGFTIGSHSVAHSDLTQQDENESKKDYLQRLRHEIHDAKTIIDKKLNQNTILFAYPFGRANPTAMAMVQQAGYRLAVTVDRGGNPFFTNPFILRRDQILKRDTATFISRLKTFHTLSLR